VTTTTSGTNVRPRWQVRLADRYGPWALVTGASDGIGRASAQLLAEAGLHLVLVARRGEVLDQLATELRREHGIRALVVATDLSDPGSVELVLERTRELDVGVVVAAAGFGTSGTFLERDLDHELEMLDVNGRSVVALAHGFGRRLAERGGGGIVLFSSLVAFQGVPGSTTYAATKAFVQSFAEGLHRELAPLGVDVLATAPGPVHSGFAARASMTMSTAADPRDVAAATLRALVRRRSRVRPGTTARLLGGSLIVLPRRLRVRVVGRIMAGMTVPATVETSGPRPVG
jgi:uncharacterized protein